MKKSNDNNSKTKNNNTNTNGNNNNMAYNITSDVKNDNKICG